MVIFKCASTEQLTVLSRFFDYRLRMLWTKIVLRDCVSARFIQIRCVDKQRLKGSEREALVNFRRLVWFTTSLSRKSHICEWIVPTSRYRNPKLLKRHWIAKCRAPAHSLSLSNFTGNHVDACNPSDQNQKYVATCTNEIKKAILQFSVFDRKRYINMF